MKYCGLLMKLCTLGFPRLPAPGILVTDTSPQAFCVHEHVIAVEVAAGDGLPQILEDRRRPAVFEGARSRVRLVLRS
jgi:hypothetical protein